MRVSPIGAAHFFTGRGLAVMASEVRWLWLPMAAALLAVTAFRRLRAPGGPPRRAGLEIGGPPG